MKDNKLKIMKEISSNIELPDGHYDAVWGGYTITINNVSYKTDIGIKCIDCKCKVKIENNILYKIK